MHKFFVSKDNIINDIAIIDGDDVKHIYKVLRLESGDKININNCVGKEYLGEIVSVDKKEVKVNLLKELTVSNESNLKITLFQGLPKSTKMDLIVQKGTELGISEITPIITERVIVKSELGEFNKTERWKRIALEACKQSKRSLIPEINTPIEFEDFLERAKEFDLIVVPYENAEDFGIKNLIDTIDYPVNKIAMVIGPEGGFEDSEIKELLDRGSKIVTLGSRILRTETAGFVCATLLQYELGDMGGRRILE
jgi:16S rRNA (uracil1498-N3)-methyltransferase